MTLENNPNEPPVRAGDSIRPNGSDETPPTPLERCRVCGAEGVSINCFGLCSPCENFLPEEEDGPTPPTELEAADQVQAAFTSAFNEFRVTKRGEPFNRRPSLVYGLKNLAELTAGHSNQDLNSCVGCAARGIIDHATTMLAAIDKLLALAAPAPENPPAEEVHRRPRLCTYCRTPLSAGLSKEFAPGRFAHVECLQEHTNAVLAENSRDEVTTQRPGIADDNAGNHVEAPYKQSTVTSLHYGQVCSFGMSCGHLKITDESRMPKLGDMVGCVLCVNDDSPPPPSPSPVDAPREGENGGGR